MAVCLKKLEDRHKAFMAAFAEDAAVQADEDPAADLQADAAADLEADPADLEADAEALGGVEAAGGDHARGPAAENAPEDLDDAGHYEKERPVDGGLSRWQDSEPVKMLSAFLKKHNDQGFSVCLNHRRQPAMHFSPGLQHPSWGGDQERYRLAVYVYDLMDDAREDIEALISSGLLQLPVVEWGQ